MGQIGKVLFSWLSPNEEVENEVYVFVLTLPNIGFEDFDK
jgi:hypothetical protein